MSIPALVPPASPEQRHCCGFLNSLRAMMANRPAVINEKFTRLKNILYWPGRHWHVVSVTGNDRVAEFVRRNCSMYSVFAYRSALDERKPDGSSLIAAGQVQMTFENAAIKSGDWHLVSATCFDVVAPGSFPRQSCCNLAKDCKLCIEVVELRLAASVAQYGSDAVVMSRPTGDGKSKPIFEPLGKK